MLRRNYDRMYRIDIAGIKVFRPHPNSELRIRRALISILQERGDADLTDDPQIINEITQAIYKFCFSLFREAVEKIYSRDLAEFLLEMHDMWSQILIKQQIGELSPGDNDRYNNLGPQARLAIQYCLETIVQLEPSEIPDSPKSEIEYWLDQMVIAAEFMVFTSGQSSSTHGLFPGKCQLRLTLDSRVSGDYIEFLLNDDVEGRLRAINADRSRLLGTDYIKFYEPANVQNLVNYLNPYFIERQGVTLTEIVSTVMMALDCFLPISQGFDVCFILEDAFYQTISQNTGLSLGKVKWIFGGLILAKEHFDKEERVLWKPKQGNRLLRKPFLHMPHPLGWHVCWKKSMVIESINYILQELCFRRLPIEWFDQQLNTAINKLSFDLDKEWENTVFLEMKNRGLVGDKSIKKVLVSGEHYMDISGDPGEIDCLFWNLVDQSLIVVEVKRTQPTYNPTHFRDEISKYVYGDKSYMTKFDKKVRWVTKNIGIILGHLLAKGLISQIPSELPIVSAVMVTKYECFARVMEVAYPISSLGNLLKRYDETSQWQVLQVT